MKKVLNALTSNVSMYIYGIFFVFVIWFFISLSQGYGNLVFPNPIETIKRTGEFLITGYIYKCIGWTILRTLIGFSIAFISALVLGTIAGSYKKIQTF